jgi:hypothetical protein
MAAKTQDSKLESILKINLQLIMRNKNQQNNEERFKNFIFFLQKDSLF